MKFPEVCFNVKKILIYFLFDKNQICFVCIYIYIYIYIYSIYLYIRHCFGGVILLEANLIITFC